MLCCLVCNQRFHFIVGTSSSKDVDCVWNVMAHAQKPDFVFLRNGRVHLNRQGRQFSRLLAADVCASAVVMLGAPCAEVVWRVLIPTPFASFPFTFPPVRHRVPSHFDWTLKIHIAVFMSEYNTRSAFFCTKQDRQCTCNVTLRRVRVIVVAVEKQSVLHILSVCL